MEHWPRAVGREARALGGRTARRRVKVRPRTLEDVHYTVLARASVTPVIVELQLMPRAEVIHFQAGQYVELCDTGHALPQRSYSIANAPRPDGLLTLLVTRVPQGATSVWVHDRLHQGDEVSLSGPYGTFVLDAQASHPLLLLAAGSGLAPARALLEAALEARRTRSVTLFHSARATADAIGREQYEGWQRSYAAFRYLLTLTRVAAAPLHGRIPALLPSLFPLLDGHEAFIAGPPDFATACVDAVRRLGARPTSVHAEAFFREPQPWTIRPLAPQGGV